MLEVDFSGFWGNEALCTALAGRIRSGNAAHAYLFEGPMGSGKKTLARMTAAALCCESRERVPCRRCEACRKIFSGKSPDLYTLGFPEEDGTRKTKSIGVEAVRVLKNDVYIRPNDLDRKLYIIDRADTMTVQAQNALLKILEEPPETVVFFLLCENRAALLATVRSRVQMFTMERFSDSRLKSLLLEHEEKAKSLSKKKPDKLSLCVRLADGAYGQALFYLNAGLKELHENPAYDAHEGAEKCLSCLFPAQGGTEDTEDMQADGAASVSGNTAAGGKTALLLLLTKVGDTRERMRGLLDALCAALRDLMALVQTEDPGTLLFFSDRERAETLAGLCGAGRLWEVYSALRNIRASMDANPNVPILQNTVTAALYRLKN